MRRYDATWLKSSIATDMRRKAGYGHFNGQAHVSADYLMRCRGFHTPTGTLLLFTRDVGHHSNGWWKNPDYERCFHLSLSFFDPFTFQHAPRDKKVTKQWLEAFFGSDMSKLWCEPPYTPDGKENDVWHYRLFCNPDWIPLIPRGEVYSREFTEVGWKSFSEVKADLEAAQEALEERTNVQH